LTWVDKDADLPVCLPTIEDFIAANSSEPLPAPSKPGGSVVLTSGTTGLPNGAPRAKVSPLATAELVDRIPFPRKGTMVIVSPDLPRHWSGDVSGGRGVGEPHRDGSTVQAGGHTAADRGSQG